MKAILYLALGAVLLSFSRHSEDENIDGIWMGYYRSGLIKEKVIVKFNSEDKMEFYTGGVDERTLCIGSYRLLGDSVSFKYKTAEGQEYIMQGQLNYRKTYVDGVWKNNDETTGKFYLEKQNVEEKFVKP